MRRQRRSRTTVARRTRRLELQQTNSARRASRRLPAPRSRSSLRAGRSCRFEPLEARYLLSVAPGFDKTSFFNEDEFLLPTGAGDSCYEASELAPCGLAGAAQTAVFEYVFDGAPTLEEIEGGAIVHMDGEQTWVSEGDPLMPVRESTILLPQGMQIASIETTYLDAGLVVAEGVQLLAAAAVPLDGTYDSADWTTSVVSQSFGQQDAAEYSNHTLCGYRLGTLNVFPIEYDAASDTLIYHCQVSVAVTLDVVDSDACVSIRASDADRQRVLELVDNPETIELYGDAEPTATGGSTMLPAAGQYEYVIVTSSALESSFQPLVEQKIGRGLTATIVTTDYIDANYSGTETGDAADRVRNFIADAYANWGTQWVLLGGDAEVVPFRGVYGQVSTTVENSLPTDMYYACLDGTWDGDGDGVWGESNDGAGGGDVDLMPEVYIGRAPASSAAEAANFVDKTIQYETTPHANATTAVWLGEQLDDSTWGSYSSIPIRDQCLPEDWTVVERYDSAGGWSGSDFAGDLNGSPHLVNHLGHANETYNARLFNSTVAGLANTDPYFMYSQGCMSGSFDTHNLCIAEQHVVDDHGAFGVVMNSRYGWYYPGSTPGGSHYYALEFWDAVFNEDLIRLGEANHDSKVDNLFRVGSTGASRWIHMETNLFGDPETSFQIGDGVVIHGGIAGTVVDDANADGQQQAGEQGLAGQTVFLDQNGNGVLDLGTVTAASTDVPIAIPDGGTASSTLAIEDDVFITDVNVTLDVTHTYDGDLEVCLISPTGTRVVLFSGVGSWGENFTGTTLDDEAATSISSAVAPFSGTFRPQGELSSFDGELSAGTWTLQVTDTMIADTGTLNSWSLEVACDEPYTVTASDGTYAFDGLSDGTYRVGHVLDSGWSHTQPVDDLQEITVAGGQIVDGVDFLATDFSATELGQVDFHEIADLNLTGGDCWYRLQTTRQGYLTIEALFDATPEVDLRLYDANRAELAVSAPSDGGERIDWTAAAGETFYVSASGDAAAVDLRLANLVRRDGETVFVYGTEGDDRLDFAAADWHQVTIDGVHYEFDAAEVMALEFNGGAGDDAAVLLGSSGADSAELRPSRATLSGPGYDVTVVNTPNLIVMGQGGDDVGCLYDSAGDDHFVATPTHARLYGTGFYNQLYDFGVVVAGATSGGHDEAELHDSEGDDEFRAAPDQAKLYGEGFYNRVVGFDRVFATASAGGKDVALFYDSAGDDTFLATPDRAKLYGDGFFNHASGFEVAIAASSAGGNDLARFCDSAGDDTFLATPDQAKMYGDGFFNRAVSFRYADAYSTAGGKDLARLYDSAGDDRLVATPGFGKLYSEALFSRATGFRYLQAFSTAGGNDLARLCDSPGDDRFVATPDLAKIYGEGFYSDARGFRYVEGYSSAGGNDLAALYDSPGDDRFVATPDFAKLYSDGFYSSATSFRFVEAYSVAGGDDTANLFDAPGDDVFVATPDYAKMYGNGFYNRASSFRFVGGHSVAGGNDVAKLCDSAGDDHLESSGGTAALFSADLSVLAHDFARTYATSSEGGTDTKHTESIDFILETQGPWTEV